MRPFAMPRGRFMRSARSGWLSCSARRTGRVRATVRSRGRIEVKRRRRRGFKQLTEMVVDADLVVERASGRQGR